jgi:hypothetical protein
MMVRKLATDCGCRACTKQLKAMDGTDKVMEANERNRTPKEERENLIRKSELL